MLNILIVGCGNIGKRHLFSINNSNNNFNIQVLEKDLEKISISKKINKGFNNYIKNDSDINKNTELLLICTKAYKREKIIKSVLKYCNPKFMIIEKIPFQKMTSYRDIIQLCKKRKIKTWVNFPFRYQPYYKFLKKILVQKNKFFSMIVLLSKSDDLFSSGIHFFDLFLHKVEKDLKIEHMKISKKNNDFNGKFKGEFVFSSKNRTIAILNGKSKFQQKVQIFGHKNNFKINFFSDVGNQWSNPKVKFYQNNKNILNYNHLWQSQLTKIYLRDIKKRGICSLPTLKESYKCNEFIIKAFKQKLRFHLKNSLCPIT
jgi:hypothetical protein